MHDELAAQIEQLRQEMAQLKRSANPGLSPSGWKGFALLLSFLLGGLVLGPLWPGVQAAGEKDKDKKDDPGAPKEIVCSALRVVGKAGKTVIELREDPDGGMINVNSTQGKERLFIAVAVDGGGLIVLRDRNEIARTTWSVAKSGAGYIRMYNADNKEEVYLASSSLGAGGFLSLNGSNGMRRLVLNVDDRGEGRMTVYDKLNKVLLDHGSDAKGGRILISGHDAGNLLYLGTDDKTRTGEIRFSVGVSELLRLGAGEGKTGGQLDLVDMDGNRTRLSGGYFDSLLRRTRVR
jgi:hypothetical protein